MNITTRRTVACVFIAIIGIAAASKPQARLTKQRVLQLTTPTSVSTAKSYRIEISALGGITFSSTKPEGKISSVQTAIFPTEFIPPQSSRPSDQVAIVPSTPANFEKFNTGWTVQLTVKPFGKLLAISGVADYVETSSVPAGYGTVAGPIYADNADVLLTPNKMNMPKVQTTTTYFQVFAMAGKEYDVLFYRGADTEKHRISITSE